MSIEVISCQFSLKIDDILLKRSQGICDTLQEIYYRLEKSLPMKRSKENSGLMELEVVHMPQSCL